MRKIKYFNEFIKESYVDSNGNLNLEENIFDEFPEDVLKTLSDNYSYMYKTNFDWNKKTREFKSSDPNKAYDAKAFSEWMDKYEQTEFVKNLNDIISAVRSDLLLLKRRKMAKRKLELFEELIKPVFGYNITGDALTKFEEEIIMNPYATIEEMEKAFKDAKNTIDEEGNIDYSKIEKSTIFVEGEINIPKFENFVKENPQYKKTFDTWYKLFNEETELMLKRTNSHHITNYKDLRKLYDFLIKYKTKF